MAETLKIVIPTAGWATRMRPQTWSKPKPLVSVAGKAVLDHQMDMFAAAGAGMAVEYVIIVGPNLGETQIPAYVKEKYPDLSVHYVVQSEMKGQSHALWLARQHLTGPVLMAYSDTLIEADLSSLDREPIDGLAWVKAVPDPRRFGVAELDKAGRITRLIEKPPDARNNLAVVGCYYFKDGQRLVAAIETQMREGRQLKGEYFLVEAVNVLLEGGSQFRTRPVEVWLDTGTLEATLETNRYLLDHGRANQPGPFGPDVIIRPPVHIPLDVDLKNAEIGPHVSLVAGCQIHDSRVADSILEAGATVRSAALTGSMLGRQAFVLGRSADEPPMVLNLGDNGSVRLK